MYDCMPVSSMLLLNQTRTNYYKNCLTTNYRPVAVGVAMQLILLTAAMLEDHKIAKMYCALYFFHFVL